MDEPKRIPDVPYIIHEGILAREERHIKRLFIVLGICIALLFASNAAWLYAWCQYDYVSEDVSIDSGEGSGNANYIGKNGNIFNGEDKGAEENP